MTSVYHTPITNGAAANAAVINAPLAALDSAIGTAMAASLLARDSILTAGTAATLANGAANAGQKVVTVDDATVFVAGATVEYALVGGVIETNTVATVDSPTQITLTTNIGTGGIPDNGLVAVVPPAYSNMRAGVYNVRDYGAAGDGSTDDTAAIQAALTACGSAGGGVVYLPTGTYIISTALTVSAATTVQGAGLGRSTIKAKSTHTGRGLYILNVAGVRVADLTIDMNSGATANQAGETVQQAIYIHQSAASAVSATIERVELKNGHDRLLDMWSDQTTALEMTVRDCYLHDCAGVGLVAYRTSHLDIRGNRLYNVGTGGKEGIWISGTASDKALNTRVIGNSLDTIGWEGIVLTHAVGFVVADNYVTNCATVVTTDGWCIAVSLGCSDFVVSGNNCVNSGGGGLAFDLAVSVPDTQTYDVNGTVTGNNSSGHALNHGIYAAYCNNLTITGNTSCANDAAGFAAGVALINCQDCVVSGNTLHDNGYGVAIFSSNDVANDGGHEVIGNSVRGSTNAPYADQGAERSNLISWDMIRANVIDDKVGFFGAGPATQVTGGAATASGTWTATEVAMLQKAYDALRTFGLLT